MVLHVNAYNTEVPSPDNTSKWQMEATTEDAFMKEAKTYMAYKIADIINTYWFSILVPIGLPGNILSFLVMIKKNNRKITTCIYMAALSVNDTIAMFICFHIVLVNNIKSHVLYLVECKLNAAITLFALQNGTYLILVMTIDKFIAIKWPHRAATLSTSGRARITALGVFIWAFIYNIPHYFAASIVGGQCRAFAISSIYTKVYSSLSFVINGLIPFMCLIYLNFVIVKTVRKSRKMFGSNDENTGLDARQKAMRSAETQVTIMLLLVTTLFLILLFPTYFRFIYLLFAGPDTPFKFAQSMLIFQITSRLYQSNSGINFFLYCLSGQKFRNDLKEVLCCCVSSSSINSKKDMSESNVTEMTMS